MTRDGDSPIYGTCDSYLLDFEIFLGMTSQRQGGEIKETDSQMPFSPMLMEMLKIKRPNVLWCLLSMASLCVYLSAPSGLAAKV